MTLRVKKFKGIGEVAGTSATLTKLAFQLKKKKKIKKGGAFSRDR